MAPPEEDSLAAVDIFEPIGQGISGTVYKGHLLQNSQAVTSPPPEKVISVVYVFAADSSATSSACTCCTQVLDVLLECNAAK